MKLISVIAGAGLVLIAMLVCGLALLAIIDPVGTKMADDNDPFGTPPSRASSLVIFCGSLGVGALGVCLVCRPFAPAREGPQNRGNAA